MHMACLISRPFALALGIYIVLNLAITLFNPQLATTEIWLNLGIPEPFQAAFAGIGGWALLVPHRAAASTGLRWALCGILCGFCVLVAAGAVSFYHGMEQGAFATDFPFPLSLLIFLILLLEFSRLWWWSAKPPRLPPPARVFVQVVALVVAFLLVTLTHVVSYGSTDFRRTADAAVIFGAKVESDGTPSAALRDRLEIGVSLFHKKLVRYLIMTGGIDANGNVEPAVMMDYAIARGVPADRILVDEKGVTTLASAKNCRAFAEESGFAHFLAVTQYFHCARVKMLFQRQGLRCYTVPTSSSLNRDASVPVKLSRESFLLFRETIAFPYYFLCYWA